MSRRPTHGARRVLYVALAAAVSMLSACSVPNGGAVTTTGLGDNPCQIESAFETDHFAHEPAQTTVVFSTIPYDQLIRGTATDGQFLHIEVLWTPKAGATAIDPTSTNLSIRLVVLSKGEVGIYGGGGFGWITDGTAEDTDIGIQITGSTLSLVERTAGFVDLLSPATMLGEIGAMKDDERARAYRRAASQLVTNKFGKARWVEVTPAVSQPVALR